MTRCIYLSMLALFACLLVCLNGWSPLIICFVTRSNAVLNCELGQALPHQNVLHCIEGWPPRQTNKQAKVDRCISSVGGIALIMNNYLDKLMVGPRPPQALPQLCHWDHAPLIGRYNIVLCCDTLSCRADCPTNWKCVPTCSGRKRNNGNQ